MRALARIACAAALAGASLGMGDAAHVIAVYPSSSDLAENTLRLSVVFDESPAPGVLARLTLEGDARELAQRAFLDQELWSLDGRTLTVLLDPGRVKTGTLANARWGRALQQGSQVSLVLDSQTLKRWHVSAPLTVGPDPGSWTITPPRAGSMGPLLVALSTPIDDLDRDMIAVAAPDGHRLAGVASLRVGETTWQFVPKTPWQSGAYRLVVNPALEDAAGNAVAQPFEVRKPELQANKVPSLSKPFEVH